MKKLIAITSGIVLLSSCSTQQQVNFLPSSPVIYQSTSNTLTHNPEFSRKLKEKKNYKVKVATRQAKSICGKNDLQQINSYDGKLGQPVEFVMGHKNPVGALENADKDNSSKFCSGTLIGEDLFLTASHCTDSSITKKFVSFNYEKAQGGSTVLKQSHFKIVKEEEDGSKNNMDYSILRLEGKPGLEFGFTKVRSKTPEKGHLLTIIQHPSGNPKQVEIGNLGVIESVYFGYSDLDTEPGSSGSGVLDKDGFLVGVHTNGGCSSSGGENRGVRMETIASASTIIKGLDILPSRR